MANGWLGLDFDTLGDAELRDLRERVTEEIHRRIAAQGKDLDKRLSDIEKEMGP